MLRWTYDSEADAAYFYLSEKPYHHGVELDDLRRVDYAEDGTPIGVEILGVRAIGVNTGGLPRGEEIKQLLTTPLVAA